MHSASLTVEPVPHSPKMLILLGIAGHFAGRDWPRGALDEPSALAYAQRTGAKSKRTLLALREFRQDQSVQAFYGFSGDGYNVRHIIKALTADEKTRVRKLVVLGAPKNPPSLYAGPWESVYRLDPPTGHMDGPRVLLAELPAPRQLMDAPHPSLNPIERGSGEVVSEASIDSGRWRGR